MYSDFKITPRFNDGDYLAKNSDWHAKDSPWKTMQIQKIINRNNLKFKTICEIGCGAGEIIKLLSLKYDHNDIKFFGYEISEDAFKICSKKGNDRLQFLKEDLLTSDVNYDLLLCIDVFEHVENYFGFLRQLRQKSKYKIFHIPLDISISSIIRGSLMQARESVGHLHYFTTDTALATLLDCGYEIIDMMHTPLYQGLKSKKLKTNLAKIPRSILYKISPKLMSTLVGGTSLMVLAK